MSIHDVRLAAAAALVILAGCHGEDRAEQTAAFDMAVACVDTVISGEGAILGAPVDLDVDARGLLYVVDALSAQVHVYAPSGEHLRSMGREGSGPGELQRPGEIAVGRDTLRVVDRGNGRLQVLTTDGAYVRSRPLPPNADGGAVDLGVTGELLVGTRGEGGRLAVLYGATGDTALTVGEPVAPSVPMWDFVSIKNRIRDGAIPDEFRNIVTPLLGTDGSIWLVLTAEGRVRRYDPEGTLRWDSEMAVPELETIRNHFFQQNREDDRPFALYSLRYVSGIAERGDEGNRMYLAVPDDATVVACSVDSRHRPRGRAIP